MIATKRIDKSRFSALLKEEDLKLYSFSRAEMANRLYISKRQLQYYLSGEKPIPNDRLNDLCELLDVTPEWITGEVKISEIHRLSLIKLEIEETKRKQENKANMALLKYLGLIGIWSSGNLNIENPESVHVTNIKGVSLSDNEFFDYMDELQNGIEYITDRFVKSLLKKRKHDKDGLSVF